MVEGGARIITSFLAERLVDHIVLTVAPRLVGGIRAVRRLAHADPVHLPRLRNLRYQWLEEDLVLWCDPAWEERMKRLALYFTAPYRVSVQEEPLSPPAADQVMVQTLVSAISPGTELLFYRGQVPTDLPVDETIAALAGEVGFPLKYGYAAVGRVVAVGAQVAPEWQDRLVFSFHPHESHFLASLAELMPVPPPVSPEEAAFLPNMETAVNFLMDGQPLIGEQVVIFGQGVVGLLTTALLARLPLAQPGHPGPLSVPSRDLLSPGRARQPGSRRATGADAVTRRAPAGTAGSRSDVRIVWQPGSVRSGDRCHGV